MVGMVMLTHKLRMTVRTKRQREALGTALEVSRELYTSNLCSACQLMTPSRIGDEFRCAYCGHTMDRDHNAALNILTRGVVIPVAQAA